MSRLTENEKARCRILMMAALDGEITSDEQDELNQFLESDSELYGEFESFQQLKEVTDTMKTGEPKPEIWETYWISVYNRIERGLAWLLFSVGAAVLIVYSLMQICTGLWSDPELPLAVKCGIFGALLGLVLLLISVMREKLFLRRGERYKEIQR